MDEPKVPDEIVELFRKVVQLCKDAECTSLMLEVSPPWRGAYHGQVKLEWRSGRHGVPANCEIVTELRTRIAV